MPEKELPLLTTSREKVLLWETSSGRGTNVSWFCSTTKTTQENSPRTVSVMQQFEIGTTFSYDWEDEDGNSYHDDILTIGGYIYYYDDLFYVCYNEDGKQVDICHEYVQEAIEDQDED